MKRKNFKFFKQGKSRKRKMNAKGISLPIYILGFLSVALIIFTLVAFNVKQKDVSDTIRISGSADLVDVNEAQVNFYLQECFDNALKDFKPALGKEVFINNFLHELKKNGEDYDFNALKDVEKQIIPENIALTNNIISLKLNLNILTVIENDAERFIDIDYRYSKEFVKRF